MREMRDALAGEPIERAVQFDRIGRCERAVDLAGRCHHADGADARGRMPSAAHIWRVKAATEVLPLVPVTAAMVAGLAGVELRRRERERPAHIGHHDDATPSGSGTAGARSAITAAAPAASA